MTQLPFQTSPAKRISFNSRNETPIVTPYRSGKLFRQPLMGLSHRALGLIEGQDSFSIYLGYTPLEEDGECWDIPLAPQFLNYYFIETNLPLANSYVANENDFRAPNFAKVIAKCSNENIRTNRVFNPRDQRFLLKNQVAGVQIHRLEDGFYGTYFNRKNGEFGFNLCFAPVVQN